MLSAPRLLPNRVEVGTFEGVLLIFRVGMEAEPVAFTALADVPDVPEVPEVPEVLRVPVVPEVAEVPEVPSAVDVEFWPRRSVPCWRNTVKMVKIVLFFAKVLPEPMLRYRR